MEQFSRDMEKMEYGKSEYFKEEYEQAISGEVAMTAGNLASAYGCTVAEASVKLTDEYTLQQMTVTLTKRKRIGADDGCTDSEKRIDGKKMG